MLKNLFIAGISSFIMFQGTSFALNSNKVSDNDKTFFYNTLLNKDLGSTCYNTEISIDKYKMCSFDYFGDVLYKLYDGVALLANDPKRNSTQILKDYSGFDTVLKPSSETNPYNYYNPEFIQWVFDNFFVTSDTSILGSKASDIYRLEFQKPVRNYARTYLGLNKKKGFFKSQQEKYQTEIKSDQYSGAEVSYAITHSFINKIPPVEADYTEEKDIITGFWIRRGIDNTDKVIWTNMQKVLNEYDKDWFTNAQKF